MMFSRLGVLNAFFTLKYVQFTMGLSGCNPILNQGASIYILYHTIDCLHSILHITHYTYCNA